MHDNLSTPQNEALPKAPSVEKLFFGGNSDSMDGNRDQDNNGNIQRRTGLASLASIR